ncbi:MAG: DUF4279 domain-containing protein [Pseudomonadota bacterium]
MTRLSTAKKRTLTRIQKRTERVLSTRSHPVRSPFFRFDASIRIGGAGKYHESIFLATGLSASRSHLVGDRVSPRSLAVRKEDLWSLASPLEGSRPIDEHINWLLDVVSPHQAFFAQVVEEAAWADLCLGCLSDIPYPLIVTDVSATKLIKMLNLTLTFNFTCR